MAENPRDSQRENELITNHRIPIDIYKGKYEVRGKIMVSPLSMDNKNLARGSVMEL